MDLGERCGLLDTMQLSRSLRVPRSWIVPLGACSCSCAHQPWGIISVKTIPWPPGMLEDLGSVVSTTRANAWSFLLSTKTGRRVRGDRGWGFSAPRSLRAAGRRAGMKRFAASGLGFCEREVLGTGSGGRGRALVLPTAPGTARWKLGNSACELGGAVLGLALVSSGLGC